MDASANGSEPPDPVSIRPATPLDLDALVALETASFPLDRLSRRSLARLLRVSSALVLVAEIRARLVGAAVVLLRSYSRRARLYSLAVAQGFEGRGVGSSLVAAAARAAAERRAAWLTLEVRADNAAARRLYERLGFARTGQTPGYYSDGEPALHFAKAIAAAQGAQP